MVQDLSLSKPLALEMKDTDDEIVKVPLLPHTHNGTAHNHETFINLFDTLLLRKEDAIDTFAEMWFSIFVWMAVTYIAVHLVGALVAFCQLRRHAWWPYMVLPFLGMSVLGAATLGLLTSGVVAWAYSTSTAHMPQGYVVAFGALQTLFSTLSSFTRILATL